MEGQSRPGQPETRAAAKSVLAHYQGRGSSDVAVSNRALLDISSKLAKCGNWFLPITYLEGQIEGAQARELG